MIDAFPDRVLLVLLLPLMPQPVSCLVDAFPGGDSPVFGVGHHGCRCHHSLLAGVWSLVWLSGRRIRLLEVYATSLIRLAMILISRALHWLMSNNVDKC
jgi:hypothetical protein